MLEYNWIMAFPIHRGNMSDELGTERWLWQENIAGEIFAMFLTAVDQWLFHKERICVNDTFEKRKRGPHVSVCTAAQRSKSEKKKIALLFSNSKSFDGAGFASQPIGAPVQTDVREMSLPSPAANQKRRLPLQWANPRLRIIDLPFLLSPRREKWSSHCSIEIFDLESPKRLESKLFLWQTVHQNSIAMQNEAGEYVDMYIPRKW